MSAAGAAGEAAGAAGENVASRVEVLVGRVGRAHGLRGDLFVEVRTDEPERRFAVGTKFATSAGRLTVEATRWHGRRLLVRFAEVSDRTAAEVLGGVELPLEVLTDERPGDPEEFYDHQLVGLSACTPEGDPIGQVTEVLHLPAQDLLAVQTASGQVGLIPFVRDMVPVVDLEARRLTVTDAVGLLPADDDDAAASADLHDGDPEG